MKYKYSVVKFVPDPIRGEFVNVGIIAGSDDSSEWELRTVENTKRARGLDDKGLLRIVWNTFDDLGRKIDRYSDAIEAGQLDEASSEVSFDWLKRLSEESQNVVQFTSPSVIVSPSIEQALEILFDQFVVEPESRSMPLFTRKNSALAAVRKAYRDVGLNGLYKVDEGATVKGTHHKERFDFVVANGRAVQLAQTWSFQNPNQEELSEQVKAWAWTVNDIRSNGGVAISREKQIVVPKDVDIGVIYIPPVSGGSRTALDEALSAFGEIRVTPVEADYAQSVATRARQFTN